MFYFQNIVYKFDLDSFLQITYLIVPSPIARYWNCVFIIRRTTFAKENARVNGEKGEKRKVLLDGIIKNVIIYITTRNEGFNEKDKRRERAPERSKENCSDVRNKKLMNTARLVRRYNAFLIDYLIHSDGPVIINCGILITHGLDTSRHRSRPA